jgi:hypothetical protein
VKYIGISAGGFLMGIVWKYFVSELVLVIIYRLLDS